MFRIFETSVNPYAPYAEDDVPPARLWPFMMAYLRPFRWVLVACVLFTTLVGIGEILLIYLAGQIVDVLAASDPGSFFRENGILILAIVVALIVLMPGISLLDSLFMNQAMMPNLGTLIRWRAHRHVIRQSVGWFENDFAGRITNRIMQTAPATGEAVYQLLDAGTYAVTYVFAASILLLGIDPALVVPLLVWAALYVLLMIAFVPRIGQASKAFSDARSAITGRIVDSYTNIQSVKLFAHGGAEEDYALEVIENSRRAFQRQMRLITLMQFLLVMLNMLLVVSVVGLSIYMWSQEAATIGTVAAAAALTLRLNTMTGWIMWAMSSLFQNLGVIAEGMMTISQPIDLVDDPDADDLSLGSGEIQFQDVVHHYGKLYGGLSGISLVVRGGEKVGIVGRSGAGKSTLVKLLLRFYDTESGVITIDGQDIAHVSQTSLRARIGMITQDSSLLHRSVRDNIAYGRPDATDAEIREAARLAEADEFIDDLRDPEGRTGYEAFVGERGVKLSGGQRQRIALARVILKDAPILVLDEATSALDSEVEASIQQTLYGVMEGKTVIAIAHRLSTIARMDRIVVLDDQKIAEEGTHRELLERNGIYARFWNSQSGGFLGTDPVASHPRGLAAASSDAVGQAFD
ncbi:MAG: ABC transporter ATP-binding protein [Paracoccaceae bacterium]|nr:ABC transporter ATP-binding protein [Paracoccaceae bacterium]